MPHFYIRGDKMSSNVIEMRNITKRFPGIIANKNITLEIRQGEIYSILGENGAGKSTLMSILFGMYDPDEGEIFIRGKKEIISSPSVAAKLNIGMVHQHFKLVEPYTISENIVLGIEPEKKLFNFLPSLDINFADNKIRELSKKYGLEVEPKQKIEEVSVSVKQRVEILKMLYRDAEILIFDEPTAVLTPQEIEFLLKIITNLRDSGKTIILITHKLEEIKKISDRFAVLRRGELVGVFDAKEASTKDMARLMVGSDVSFDIEKKKAKLGKEVLKVCDLTVKNMDNFEIVKDVNFNIHENEIFAIAGVSDNGQIEIADAIYGLIGLAKGKIYLNGKDITNMSIRERVFEGISYIPEDRQNVGLILEFDVANNFILKNYFKEPFCKRGFLNKEDINSFADSLIKTYDVRCNSGAKTTTRSMSGGNQQKLIIAREIELDSKLIIFVQPTRGLDIGAISNIRKRILEERDKGNAILLISLELDEIMSLADTIGIIYNGKLVKISPSDSLTQEEVGEYMMGVNSQLTP